MPEQQDFQQLALSPIPFEQLPPEAQAIRRGQSPAPIPGFTVSIPERLSVTDLSGSMASPVVPEDVRKLISDLQSQQLRTVELMKPSERERQLQQQIVGLQTGAELGLAKIEEQAIPMPLILGQQAALERQAQAKLAGPQRQLGIEQQARLGELQGQQSIQTQTQQNLNTVISLANQLQDNARNALSTVLTNFGGLAFEDLDENTQRQLSILARNTGLPENLLKAGLKTVKERQLEQKATQVQTEVTDIGNKRVLINRQTGETIKDLGPTPRSIRKPEEDISFTDTQLTKGAANANVSISDFSKFSQDSQNFFINKKSVLDETSEAIKNSANKKGPFAGKTSDEIEKELSESAAPEEVKNYLVKKLKEAFKKKTQGGGIKSKVKRFFRL